MKKSAGAVLIAAAGLLGACGGGGGGGGDGAGTGNPSGGAGSASQAANPLAAYVGTWKTECFANMTMTNVFAEGAQQATVSLTQSVNYHAPSDRTCTGPTLMVQTFTPPSIIAHTGTVLAKVTVSGGNSLTGVKIDKATIAHPVQATTVTGAGVRLVQSNGEKQWCTDIPGGGGTYCLSDRRPEPATAPAEIGFHRSGDKMYWDEIETGAELTYRGTVMTRQP